MDEAPPTQEAPKIDCPSCAVRNEKLLSIGVAVFFVSLFSCGLLMPVSIVAAIIIQSLTLRKCKACRLEAKSSKKNIAQTMETNV